MMRAVKAVQQELKGAHHIHHWPRPCEEHCIQQERAPKQELGGVHSDGDGEDEGGHSYCDKVEAQELRVRELAEDTRTDNFSTRTRR